MIAKIRDVGFSPGKIVIGVDCYFEQGEAGYNQCFVDVPDFLATDIEPNPPTHKEFIPFRSLSLALPVDTTKQQAIDAIEVKLEAFKRAHQKVAQAQQFIGEEIKV